MQKILKYIQQVLGGHEGQLSPKQLVDLAQDKMGWKKLAIACCAADR